MQGIKVSERQMDDWSRRELSENDIRVQLEETGITADEIEQHLAAYRKAAHSRRSTEGFRLLAIGGFIGFISCVLSMIVHHPNWNALFLYGFTSLAIIVVVYGMYVLFE